MNTVLSFKKQKHLILWLVFWITFIFLFRISNLIKKDQNLLPYENTKTILCGVIEDEPVETTLGKKFVMRVFGIAQNTTASKNKISVCEKFKNGMSYVLVKTKSLDSRIEYGREVHVEARIVKPKIIEDSRGKKFNYPAYLRKSGIFYLAESAHVKIAKNEIEVSVSRYLFLLKNKFMKSVESHLPAPHSFLANGLVISGKGSMSSELQMEFQRVGLIVVLSGSNVSIIGEAIMRIVSFLPLFWASLLGGLSIVFFSIMVGGGATVLRSVLMSIIGLTARVTGRTNSALASLFLAALCMLVWNPLLLLYDASFQLSFTASLGLILYAPRIADLFKRVLRKIKDRYSIVVFLSQKIPVTFKKSCIEIISSSIGTQIATLPLILKISGMISIVSLPVNLLLLPLIPYTMLTVFVTGVTGFMGLVAPMIPSFVSWIFLTFILTVVHFVSGLHFAVVQLPPIQDSMVCLMYVIMTVEFLFFTKKLKQVIP
jgi:competence protein ComEC